MGKVNIEISSLLKPIQYLGAKDRVLNSILTNSTGLYNGGYVLDLFTGSSIVSQGYSMVGANVIANDVQKFSQDIATTMLKVGFSESDAILDVEEIVAKESTFAPFYRVYSEFIESESRFIEQRNTLELLKLYDYFPKYWNYNKGRDAQFASLFSDFEKNIASNAVGKIPLFTSIYAGTYFGITQSLEVDELRWKIQRLNDERRISDWKLSFYLTCLHSVISSIVNSAGKHFAQPIKEKNIKNSDLLEKRLYKNRSLPVKSLFKAIAKSLMAEICNRSISKKNKVLSKPMEELIQSSELNKIDLVYADPPYTAQQYSRFYHIPDILSSYIIPELQIHRGSITTGLYPENKFKSRFCSVRKAPEAFLDLFKLVGDLKSNLVLSYSLSKSSETGNKRMIGLEELLELINKVLPDYYVEIKELDLSYKQLNRTESIIKKSEDREVLIIVKKNK